MAMAIRILFQPHKLYHGPIMFAVCTPSVLPCKYCYHINIPACYIILQNLPIKHTGIFREYKYVAFIFRGPAATARHNLGQDIRYSTGQFDGED
jgi:hypothetical protein